MYTVLQRLLFVQSLQVATAIAETVAATIALIGRWNTPNFCDQNSAFVRHDVSVTYL